MSDAHRIRIEALEKRCDELERVVLNLIDRPSWQPLLDESPKDWQPDEPKMEGSDVQPFRPKRHFRGTYVVVDKDGAMVSEKGLSKSEADAVAERMNALP